MSRSGTFLNTEITFARIGMTGLVVGSCVEGDTVGLGSVGAIVGTSTGGLDMVGDAVAVLSCGALVGEPLGATTGALVGRGTVGESVGTSGQPFSRSSTVPYSEYGLHGIRSY